MQSRSFSLVFLLSFLRSSFAQPPPGPFNAEIRLPSLPLYTDANTCVQICVYSASYSLKSSLGCLQTNPATCICTDKRHESSLIASSASSCASVSCGGQEDATTVQSIWSQYCYTNMVNLGLTSKTGGSSSSKCYVTSLKKIYR